MQMTPPASRLGLGGGFVIPVSDQLLAQEGDAADTSRIRPLFSHGYNGDQVQLDADSDTDGERIDSSKQPQVSAYHPVFRVRIPLPICYSSHVPWLHPQDIGRYVDCHHPDGSNRELRLNYKRLQPESGTVRIPGIID